MKRLLNPATGESVGVEEDQINDYIRQKGYTFYDDDDVGILSPLVEGGSDRAASKHRGVEATLAIQRGADYLTRDLRDQYLGDYKGKYADWGWTAAGLGAADSVMWNGSRKLAEAFGVPGHAIVRDNPWEYGGANVAGSVLLGAAATLASGGAAAPAAATRASMASAKAIQLLRGIQPIAKYTPAGASALLGKHIASNPAIAARMAAGALPGALALGPAGIPLGALAGQMLRGKAAEGAGRFIAEKTPELLKNAVIGYGARVGGITADAMASTVVSSSWDADWRDIPGAAEYVLDATGKSSMFAAGLTAIIGGGFPLVLGSGRLASVAGKKGFVAVRDSEFTQKVNRATYDARQWAAGIRGQATDPVTDDYMKTRAFTGQATIDRDNLADWNKTEVPELQKVAAKLVDDVISSKGSVQRWSQMGFDKAWIEGRIAQLAKAGEGVPNAAEAASQTIEFIDAMRFEVDKLMLAGQKSGKVDPLTKRPITKPVISLSAAEKEARDQARQANLPWEGPEADDFADITLPPSPRDLPHFTEWLEQLDGLKQRILSKVEREAHQFVAGKGGHTTYQKLSREAHETYVQGRVRDIANQAQASGDYFPSPGKINLRFEKFTPDFLEAHGKPGVQAEEAISPAFVVSEGSKGTFVPGVDVDATHTIFIDQDLIAEGYLNSSWSKPTIEGVDPLTRRFASENEWMTWLVEHELAHIRKPKAEFFEAVAEESADWTAGRRGRILDALRPGGRVGEDPAGLSNITGRAIKRTYGDADYENYINDLAGTVSRDGRPRVSLEELYKGRKGQPLTLREQALMGKIEPMMEAMSRADGDTEIMLGHILENAPHILTKGGMGDGTITDMFSSLEKFAATIQRTSKEDLLSKDLLEANIPNSMKEDTGSFLSGKNVGTNSVQDPHAPKRAWGGLIEDKAAINEEFLKRDGQQKIVENKWAIPNPKDPRVKQHNWEEIKQWSNAYGEDEQSHFSEALLSYAKQTKVLLQGLIGDGSDEGFYFGQDAVTKLNALNGTNYSYSAAKKLAKDDLFKITKLVDDLEKVQGKFNSEEMRNAMLFKKAMASEQHAGEVFGGGGGLQGGPLLTQGLTALGAAAGAVTAGPAGAIVGGLTGGLSASALGYVSDVVMAPMRSLNRVRTIEILTKTAKKHFDGFVDEFFEDYATNAPKWYEGKSRFPRGLISPSVVGLGESFRMEQEREAGIDPEKGALPGKKRVGRGSVGVGRGRKRGGRGPKERDEGGAKSFDEFGSKDIDNAKKILGRLIESPGMLEKLANNLIDKSYDDASPEMAQDLRDAFTGAAHRLYTALPKKRRADILFEEETPYTDDQVQKFATVLGIEENGYRIMLEMLIRGTVTREAVAYFERSHPQQSADMKQAFAMHLEDPKLRNKIPESMRAPIRIFMGQNMDINLIARAQQTWAPPEEGGGQGGGSQRKGTAKKMNLPVGGTMQSIVERGMTGSMAGTAIA